MNVTTAASAAEIAHELVAVLPRWNRIVARELRGEAGNDLTVVQIRVLGELSEGALTLSMLARKREVSLQAASEHVQALVARGLVERIPDPTDRRQALLTITEEGLRQLTEVREHVADRFTPRIERLSDADAEALHRGLQALWNLLATDEPVSEQPEYR